MIESDDLRELEGRDRVKLLGIVPDLQPLFNSARIFIAPTRFAAGLPHKVQEASAAGVPVVATRLIANQLGRTDSEDILTADTAAEFSDACYELYSKPDLWADVRDNALKRIVQECDGDKFNASIKAILSGIASHAKYPS